MCAMFYPVILAGGSGERFWPLSRQSKPKQFLTLDGTGLSLLQATAQRLTHSLCTADQLLVVTSNDHRGQVLEQLPELPLENLLVEPVARDTAAAVLYAALTIARDDPEAIMGVFAADHRITQQSAFDATIGQAIAFASAHEALITIGIKPTYPATGYGYIEVGAGAADPGIHRVQRFVEKPSAEVAEQLLSTGNYLWNAGMFVWSVQAVLRAFEQYAPELWQQLSQAAGERGGFRRVYPELPKISVDYAIMEHAQNVVVIPATFDWDDLGDWNALERLLKGEGANVVVGRHVTLDTGGAILYTTEGEGLTATIGLDDVVVVRSGDVTLVVKKDRTQDIKKVVQQLKAHPELSRFA